MPGRLKLDGTTALLKQVLEQANVSAPPCVTTSPSVQFDILYKNGEPAFIVLQNTGKEPVTAKILLLQRQGYLNDFTVSRPRFGIVGHHQ